MAEVVEVEEACSASVDDAAPMAAFEPEPEGEEPSRGAGCEDAGEPQRRRST